jgi:hypothetical protein
MGTAVGWDTGRVGWKRGVAPPLSLAQGFVEGVVVGRRCARWGVGYFCRGSEEGSGGACVHGVGRCPFCGVAEHGVNAAAK